MKSRIYPRAFGPEDYKMSVERCKDYKIWSIKDFFYAYEKEWIEGEIFLGKDVKLAICHEENVLYIGNLNQIYDERE